MLNYELAKELKDAGFPQTLTETTRFVPIKGKPYPLCDFILPSLSELIEACGDRFGSLTRWYQKDNTFIKKGQWIAYNNDGEYDIKKDNVSLPKKTISMSAEEAVAKLWLCLQSPCNNV